MKIREKIQIIVVEQKRKDDYSLGIDFMHSFGLNCDCVGWAEIVLDSDEKLELVKKIGDEAKRQKLRIRCCYEKEITDVDSEWYFINPGYHLNNDYYDFDYVSTKDTIKGYKIPKGINLISIGGDVAVSKEFIDICKEEDFTGISFMWVNDSGRYKAEPFFYAYSEVFVTNPTTGGGLFHRDTKFTKGENTPYCQQADLLGGNLTLLNDIFYSMEFSEIPIMIDKNNMPDTDFAYVSNDGCSNQLLVRKTVAEKLLKKGLLNKKELIPAMYYDKDKQNLLITNYLPEKFISQDRLKKVEEEYKKFLKKKKPEYVPTEKVTLSLLRKVKRENSDRFTKALKKNSVESLMDTILAPMTAYYKISNGGELSDEVEYYPYEEIEKDTSEFWGELKLEEEFLEKMPQLIDSVVIGGTANGDTILLCTNGQVMRYDHEDPFLSQEWKSVFEFFYDNLEITVLN